MKRHALSRAFCLMFFATGCKPCKEDTAAVAVEPSAPVAAPLSTPPPMTSSAPTEPVVADNPPSLPLQPLPAPLPGERQDVTGIIGEGLRVAIGNVDNKPGNEVVVVDKQKIRVLTGSLKLIAEKEIPGGIQSLTVPRGGGMILAGYGVSAFFREAKMKAIIYTLRGKQLVEEVAPLPETSRQEVCTFRDDPRAPGTLFISFFESKYIVQLGRLTKANGSWSYEKQNAIRMATGAAFGDLDGTPGVDLLITRVYGDTQDAEGDAFILTGETRTPLPTLRGVRGSNVLEIDGKSVLFVGDGWHRRYAEIGRGLLSAIRREDSGVVRTVIDNTPGQYSLWGIDVGDTNGDGQPELVSQGSHYVQVWTRSGTTWSASVIGGLVRDLAVGDLDGKPGDEVLLAADKSELVTLHN